MLRIPLSQTVPSVAGEMGNFAVGSMGRVWVVSLALMAICQTAQAGFEFTFDSDPQGWTGLNLPTNSPPFSAVGSPLNILHQAAGGNPGGFVGITDPDNGDFYFQAPSTILGDLSRLYGGSLSYELKVDLADYDGAPDVIMVGDGLVLVAELGTPTPGEWSRLSVCLGENGPWKLGSLSGAAPSAAEFVRVLSNLTSLRIRGEYVAGQLGVEVGRMDNVFIVPEPGIWALIGSPLALLACRRALARTAQ